MKKTKLIPLMMVAPLLMGCNGLFGPKTMKKPAFAAYSNKVEDVAKFYEDVNKVADEVFKANFIYEGEDIASLDKGCSFSVKHYEKDDFKVSFNRGSKMSSSSQLYEETHVDGDAATIVVKNTDKGEQKVSLKGATTMPMIGIRKVGTEVMAAFDYLPSFNPVETSYDQKKDVEVYQFFQNKKMISANMKDKAYSEYLGKEFDEKEQKRTIAEGFAETILQEFEDYAPLDSSAYKYDRYMDDKVFTTVLKLEGAGGTVKYNNIEFAVTSSVERIYQIDFNKIAASYSEEITIEMSNADEGKYNYTSKHYKVAEAANKKVSLKTPDISKFKNASALL